jgi:hypothetical protein
MKNRKHRQKNGHLIVKANILCKTENLKNISKFISKIAG